MALRLGAVVGGGRGAGRWGNSHLQQKVFLLLRSNPRLAPLAVERCGFRHAQGSIQDLRRKPWPVEVRHRKAEKVLEIEFKDGKRFRYPAELLRVVSPSADNLRTTSSGEQRVVAGRRHVGILSIEPIGNYALKLNFDDLHDTGIYTWDFLYELGENKIDRIRTYLQQLRLHGRHRDPKKDALKGRGM